MIGGGSILGNVAGTSVPVWGLDIIRMLRQEAIDHPKLFESPQFDPDPKKILLKAA